MSDPWGVAFLPAKKREKWGVFLWHFDTVGNLMSDDLLRAAFAELTNPEGAVRSRNFPVASRNYIQRRKDAMKRKDRAAARKLIRPKNADAILDALPAAGDLLHAVTCGDFVLGDLIGRLIDRKGSPVMLTISTLSMSVNNAEMLSRLMGDHPGLHLELLLSHYFKSTNGEVFTAVESLITEKFSERARVGIQRSHAKVILWDYGEAGPSWVMETSANLRSSNNMEQMVISNDRKLLFFHREWIREMIDHE